MRAHHMEVFTHIAEGNLYPWFDATLVDENGEKLSRKAISEKLLHEHAFIRKDGIKDVRISQYHLHAAI